MTDRKTGRDWDEDVAAFAALLAGRDWRGGSALHPFLYQMEDGSGMGLTLGDVAPADIGSEALAAALGEAAALADRRGVRVFVQIPTVVFGDDPATPVAWTEPEGTQALRDWLEGLGYGPAFGGLYHDKALHEPAAGAGGGL